MTLRVAVVQMRCGDEQADNVERAEAFVREAAGRGAQLVLLQELFSGPYFCKTQDPAYLEWARPRAGHSTIARFAALARELQVVIPLSFFERAGNAFFNSLVMLDADGSELGLYRKSHIPDGPGYQEKFYFSPGDTGFKVFDTHYGRIGAAICWDQWFPEAARCLALQGAELIVYPSAIGSEPADPDYQSLGHWQRVMQGHAAANMVPVAASNRVGSERQDEVEVTFYGGSFVADVTGAKIAEADGESDTIIYADLDLAQGRRERAGWGIFRDRRPDLYARVSTFDGGTDAPAA